MAVAYRSSTLVTPANIGATVTRPAGSVSGDLLVAVVTAMSPSSATVYSGTFNTPTGWTAGPIMNGANYTDPDFGSATAPTQVFYRVSDNTATDLPVFTFTPGSSDSGGERVILTTLAFTGAATTNPIYGFAGKDNITLNADKASITVPTSGYLASTNDLAVAVCFYQAGNTRAETISASSPFTIAQSYANNFSYNYAGYMVAYATSATLGTTTQIPVVSMNYSVAYSATNPGNGLALTFGVIATLPADVRPARTPYAPIAQPLPASGVTQASRW